MESLINKKTLEYLEELARMKVNPRRAEKLLKDLEKILEHFEELKEIDTKKVSPMNGGTFLKNVFKGDEINANLLDRELVVRQFPESQDGFLKIPPVFS